MALQKLTPDDVYDLVMRFREAGATQVTVGTVAVVWSQAPVATQAETSDPKKPESPKIPSLADAARQQGIGPLVFPTRSD